MKRPLETSQRWFRQAEHDLGIAEKLKEDSPADACYFSEQAGQKALKAFLYLKGSRSVPEHSIGYLAKLCTERDPSFPLPVQRWSKLDQYYIPTRYPDGLADPAVPFESYSVVEASEAIQIASEIMEAVRRKIA